MKIPSPPIEKTLLPQINCDLGEGCPAEEAIFPYIDVASLACGGHFGSKDTMRTSIRLAKKFNKRVGAHPSYPDKETFGRISLKISLEELIQSLSDQIHSFLEVAQQEQIPLDHIKFHGALYNDSAKDPILAELVTEYLFQHHPNVPVLVPPHSWMFQKAKQKGLSFRLEVFADRSYTADYLLVSRSQSGALLTEKTAVESQVKHIIFEGQLETLQGEILPIEADTLCFHGDNPGILEFLPELRKTYWT